MAEPETRPADTPVQSAPQALARSHRVFLDGCGLPGAWAGRSQWVVLETAFGPGLNFLATWQAWRADAQRPRMLHFVSIATTAPDAAHLLHLGAAADPELAPLANALAAQWHGLLPGFHRLAFDEGRVLLTLCIGDVQPMLRAQRFEADSLFLDGFDAPAPQSAAPMASPDTLKAVSRFARQGTGLAAATATPEVRAALAQNGFQVDVRQESESLSGVFAPAWTVRRRGPPPSHVEAPGRCAVIGAGLAGAAVAASLARRGWQVTVLDAADRPASGASALPVGVMAPHVSPDDALLSRLTRAGIRATWVELERLLREGVDWRASGVLERRPEGDLRVPPEWRPRGPNESWPATEAQRIAAGLSPDAPSLWHARAGWVRPSRLVEAWLRTPGIQFRGGTPVARIVANGAGWQLHDAEDRVLAEADRVVIAAGFDSRRFASALPLQPVRGQVAWGLANASVTLPDTPLNGDGHLIAQVPEANGTHLWLAGATYDRDSTALAPQPADAEANRQRLAALAPHAAVALAPDFAGEAVHAWVGIRCASGDRRPLVGPLGAPGLWVCTALGSRGLSFAALCAELLAARWHGEPLPLQANMAQALGTERAQAPGAQSAAGSAT